MPLEKGSNCLIAITAYSAIPRQNIIIYIEQRLYSYRNRHRNTQKLITPWMQWSIDFNSQQFNLFYDFLEFSTFLAFELFDSFSYLSFFIFDRAFYHVSSVCPFLFFSCILSRI